MKTKEQILEWLDKQPWKNEFYENLLDRKLSLSEENSSFLYGSFDFASSPQGIRTWLSRNDEYLKWYNSNDKPMSWEEYCEQNPLVGYECFISSDCSIIQSYLKTERDFAKDANVMSEELCKAFLAYMKLIQLRNAWVKDEDIPFYKLIVKQDKVTIDVFKRPNGLSFPSSNMASEFLSTFKDLLEIAKPLL